MYAKLVKPCFDYTLASVLFIVLLPLMLVISCIIWLSSGRPIYFLQTRSGKNYTKFKIIKFRTMKAQTCTTNQSQIDFNAKSRITKIGTILRKTKLDEIPQIINVLKGDMSFVGPRPEVTSVTSSHKEQFNVILKIKPGITDYASIKYSNEEEMLKGQTDPKNYYYKTILPSKLLINIKYVKEISSKNDLMILYQTFKTLIKR
jgi:lipopolysaccharide/colanic/teichoic acid biosynthesis glycosyltransferase